MEVPVVGTDGETVVVTLGGEMMALKSAVVIFKKNDVPYLKEKLS